jgi:hypothetical protein
MKKLLLALAMVAFGATAQNIKTPQPSPTQTLKQDFALSAIELNYSRPMVNGRKIFGELVPFGAMWRTGANGASKLTFGEDVKVGGVAVKAGTYALYSIPNAAEWEIIINKGANNGGLNGYKAEEDVARFKVKTMALPMNIESFTIMVSDVKAASANLMVMWEKTAVSIPVEADIDAKIMASIDNALNKDNKPYAAAATYYLENGKDLTQALAWINRAIDAQPKAFWLMTTKAKIQAKAGDKVGAKATSLLAIAEAKNQKNNDYVVINEKLIAGL